MLFSLLNLYTMILQLSSWTWFTCRSVIHRAHAKYKLFTVKYWNTEADWFFFVSVHERYHTYDDEDQARPHDPAYERNDRPLYLSNSKYFPPGRGRLHGPSPYESHQIPGRFPQSCPPPRKRQAWEQENLSSALPPPKRRQPWERDIFSGQMPPPKNHPAWERGNTRAYAKNNYNAAAPPRKYPRPKYKPELVSRRCFTVTFVYRAL